MLVIFLLRARYVPEVVRAFESKRPAFVDDWRAGRHGRFSWKMEYQKETEAYKETQKSEACADAGNRKMGGADART